MTISDIRGRCQGFTVRTGRFPTHLICTFWDLIELADSIGICTDELYSPADIPHAQVDGLTVIFAEEMDGFLVGLFDTDSPLPPIRDKVIITHVENPDFLPTTDEHPDLKEDLSHEKPT